MSVVSCNSFSSEGGYGEDGVRTYTSQWIVVTNATTDGPPTVIRAGGLPTWGSGYAYQGDTDLTCRVRSVRVALAEVEKTRKKWLVTVGYSSKGDKKDQDPNEEGDPTNWNWRYSGSFTQFMVAPEKDIDDRPLVNTTKEPFLPPPEIEDGEQLLVLEKNHPTISLTTWVNSRHKVNSVAMWNLGVRCVKLRQWAWAVKYTSPSESYIENTLTVGVRAFGYYYQPLNAGWRENGELDANGKRLFNYAKSEEGFPLSRPRLLDENGKFLADAATPTFFDQAAGNLKRFKLEDEYDLSTILPATFPSSVTA